MRLAGGNSVNGALPCATERGYNLMMNNLSSFQTLLMTGLGGILFWLIWNGISNGSVWVRGVRDMGSADPGQWATPVSRETSPSGYWLALGLYSAGLLFVLWTLATFG